MDDERRAIYFGKPLHNSRDIRVIDIEPADDFNAPFCCSLRVISLDNEDKYQALSYAWGCLNNTETILCDGKSLTVTEDLQIALRRIREKIAPRDIFSRTIWIDAISIDQSNGSEKSKQVAMMGDIFKRSQRLIVWLGDADTDEVDGIRIAVQGKPESPQATVALIKVAQRSWFQRRWVIQEVVKSPRSARHVLLRDFRCRFDYLFANLQRLLRTGDDSVVAAIRSATILESTLRGYRYRQHTELRETHRPKSSPTLLDNLVIYGAAKCSNPHDFVYALLNLSSEGADFKVDYESHSRDTYISFAKCNLKSPESLATMLMCATLKWRRPLPPDLPSWVPDWAVVEQIISFGRSRGGDRWETIISTRRAGESMPYLDGKQLHEIGRYRTKLFALEGTVDEHDHLFVDGWLLRRCGHAVDYKIVNCVTCQRHSRTWWSSVQDRFKIKPTEKLIALEERKDIAIFYMQVTAALFILQPCAPEDDSLVFTLDDFLSVTLMKHTAASIPKTFPYLRWRERQTICIK